VKLGSGGGTAVIPAGILAEWGSVEPVARMTWTTYQIPRCKRFRSNRNIQSTARNISCLPLLVAWNQAVPRRTHALWVKPACSLNVWISVNKRSRCKAASCWPNLLCLRRPRKDVALRPPIALPILLARGMTKAGRSASTLVLRQLRRQFASTAFTMARREAPCAAKRWASKVKP